MKGERIMENLLKLRDEDLTRRLKTFTEELEELEEEKGYVLRQTGLHVSGGVMKKYDSQTVTLTESIAELKAEIERRK
jgi:hypothetical protein